MIGIHEKQAFASQGKVWDRHDPGSFHSLAEEVAEALFPEKPKLGSSEPDHAQLVVGPSRTRIVKQNGVPTLVRDESLRIAQTFASDLFAKMDFFYQGQAEPARELKELYVDMIYSSSPIFPPVGWMEVVHAADFASYIAKISQNNSILWKIFDIEIFPFPNGWRESDVVAKLPALNGNISTDDVYYRMTPRNWS
ncbi:MAG: hypothetical protein Fur005_08460 [Roseiflexaceae bacterium]